MKEYVILIGLATYADLGEAADRDKSKRLSAIYDVLFSLGPAWTGNQGSVLLKTEVSRAEVLERLTPLLGLSDLLAVMEIAAKSITTVGYIADEEGLDAVYPQVTKLGVSSSGDTYPISGD